MANLPKRKTGNSPGKKSEKKAQREPVKYPESVTIAELAEISGMSERRIQELAQANVLPKSKGAGGYPFKETVTALFAYQRELAAGLPARTAADRGRQARAEADSAEMKAAKEAGLLMFTADARRVWVSGFVQIREIISRLPGVSKKVKVEITERLKKVRVVWE